MILINLIIEYIVVYIINKIQCNRRKKDYIINFLYDQQDSCRKPPNKYKYKYNNKNPNKNSHHTANKLY